MNEVRPELELVKQLYGTCLPEYGYILRKIEANKNWIKLPRRLHEMTTHLKCENYPELYQGENRIQTALFRAMFENDEEILQYLNEFESYSPEQQTQHIDEFFEEAYELEEWMDGYLISLDELEHSPKLQAKLRDQFEKLSPENQQQSIKNSQCAFSFMLASFFNYFVLMVHGRKLTQLVGEAMAGNDNSFCLAVHIDKNIIHHIPYFVDRYKRAHQDCEVDFLEKVSFRLQSPQLKGKIQHRLLYMLFALLEGTNWLNELKHKEILNICDELGLDRYENRIETENALTKRLKDYRGFQKFNGMSMP